MPVTAAAIPVRFADLHDEWPQLVATDPGATIFQTWAWQKTWWDTFGGDAPLHLLAVRAPSGQLLGVAPFYQTSQGRLAFIGGSDVTDYVDIVARDGHRQAVWEAIFPYLDASGAAITGLELQSVPDWSETPAIVTSLAGQRGLQVRTLGREPCPVIELAATWDDYLAGLGKKDRHEIRRKVRRVERELPTAHLYVTEREDDLDRDLEDFIRLHRASDHAKARFMTDTMQDFFRAAAHQLFGLDRLRLYFLQTSEERLAATLCFDFRNAIAVYNSGFEPHFGGLSVGVVLFALCIQRAIEEGKRAFDFLRGSENYKYRLGSADTFVAHLVIDRTVNE